MKVSKILDFIRRIAVLIVLLIETAYNEISQPRFHWEHTKYTSTKRRGFETPCLSNVDLSYLSSNFYLIMVNWRRKINK